jgi:hypothetical protein
MPVTTCSTARRRFLLRRWVRRGRGLVGGVLLVVAGLAFWVGFLGGVLTVALIIDKNSGLDPQLRPQILTTWLWVAAVAVSARFSARTLLDTPRRMVLWLRRFRHAESIRAVSTALDHLGHSWRVVTLDDATAQPYGAAAGLRLSVSAASAANRAVSAIQRWVSARGTWVVRGYLAAWVALVAWTVWRGQPVAVLDALSGDWRQWPVPWAVAAARLLAGAAIALFAGLLAFLAVYLLLLVLLPVAMMAGSVGDGVRTADARKRQTVTTLTELTEVAATVSSGARAALAPRLTVVSVASEIWREAVHDFARSCNAVLLDVSATSEALLWEVSELSRRRVPLVFVGEETAVRRLLSGRGPGTASATVHDVALGDALDGCEILTYRATLWGRVRFQRALYGTLEVTAPPRLSLTRARRWAVTFFAVAVVVLGLREVVSTVMTWPWERLIE